jgi:hypothetical protein
VLVSFGGVYVYNSIKSLEGAKTDYPFDTLYGGDFMTYSLFAEMTLGMSDSEIENFVKEMFCIDKTEIYLQAYNNKLVCKNLPYNISFPHENIGDLEKTYCQRFKNFRNLILGKEPITLVYCTHWEKVSVSLVNYTLGVLHKYNPNVKFLVINALEKNDSVSNSIIVESVVFPEEYKNKDWPQNKIAYDQTVFRNSVLETIKKYV